MSVNRIETAEDAKAEMLAWANGEKSHWRDIVDHMRDNNRGLLTAACHEADAATAQMWAGVYQALLAGENTAVRVTCIDTEDRKAKL